MKLHSHENEVELLPEDDFDLRKIFECGQCFRWNTDGDGEYIGVAGRHAARLRQCGDRIFISGSAEDFENIWYDYFDLEHSYAEIRKGLCIDDYMTAACGYGAGIRILKQDRWETLCSFIISQCNNIPRIKKIVETLCGYFGDKIEFEGREFYTFPAASRLALLEPDDLAPLRCGYRAPYIIDAAKAVADGKIDLDALADADLEGAKRSLKSLNGVGEKVANCAILFSLRKLDAFPMDVWIKRAVTEHYGADFDPAVFGKYAGIAQQYMFFYQREEAAGKA